MTVASRHTQACFNAWINCENLLTDLVRMQAVLSKRITKTLDECAYICMGTFHALKTSPQNAKRMALLCMGICEECAEICEEQKEAYFQDCARICRQCSDTMNALAFTD